MVVKPLPRGLLLLAYLFMCISSLMSFFVPLVSFQLLSWAVWIYIWAGCLTAGGLMGAVAALLRRTSLELIGVTLLLTGYAAYLVVLGKHLADVVEARQYDQITGNVFVLGSILALVMLLVRRWIEQYRLVRDPLPTGSPGGRE